MPSTRKYSHRWAAKPMPLRLLLGLLFYGYATGVFSSRKIEKATYESIPFRFLAGGWHPDHDTIANFRKTFLPEITELFAQVLVIAHELGVLKLGRHQRGWQQDSRRRVQKPRGQLWSVAATGAETACSRSRSCWPWQRRQIRKELPEGLDVESEIALREERLLNLAQAKTVLEARAQERYEAEASRVRGQDAGAGREGQADRAQAEGQSAPNRLQPDRRRRTSTTSPIPTRES